MFKPRFRLRMTIGAGWLIFLLVMPLSAISQTQPANQTSAGAAPTLGSPSAPVTIIEFSDFQCSFCKRFWVETLPRLKEAYLDTGKARFIYRHFAILGKHSEQAALAAACAQEQGKFWEYHDQLFRNQGGLAFTEAKLDLEPARERRDGLAELPRTGFGDAQVDNARDVLRLCRECGARVLDRIGIRQGPILDPLSRPVLHGLGAGLACTESGREAGRRDDE